MVMVRVPHLNKMRSGGWVMYLWVQLYLINFQVGTGIILLIPGKKVGNGYGYGYIWVSIFPSLLIVNH